MQKKDFVTVGVGTAEQREIEIKSYIIASFIGDRKITIMELIDSSILCFVENPPDSGRDTKQEIWLTRESLVAFMGLVITFFGENGENLADLMKAASSDDCVEYTFKPRKEN